MRSAILAALTAALLCGCETDYCWRSAVPESARTVSVPTFRNESDVAELGAIASRQILREFQREGTFKIRATGDAAIEIQGTIKSTSTPLDGFDRRSARRYSSYEFTATAEVSVVDKRNGKVLVNNRLYTARSNFTSGQDLTTSQRNASGRLMEDLARQVVDDILNLKW